MTSKLTIENPEQRLRRVLKENAGKYFIDEDGRIHTNWQHPEVQETMRKHFAELSKIKVGRK
ncbi:TPA: hypothetical protein ACUE4H_003448 [Klebsiella quasipneumoniae]